MIEKIRVGTMVSVVRPGMQPVDGEIVRKLAPPNNGESFGEIPIVVVLVGEEEITVSAYWCYVRPPIINLIGDLVGVKTVEDDWVDSVCNGCGLETNSLDLNATGYCLDCVMTDSEEENDEE